MKKVTCISFHGTGSGAIDDYLKEFNNVSGAPSNYESRFLYDPDGLMDLYYNVCINPNRLNSEFAIKRYKEYVIKYKRTYEKIFGNKWIRISNSFIDNISEFSYYGYWVSDMRYLNPVIKAVYYFRRLIDKVMPKRFRKPVHFDYFPRKKMYQPIYSKENFIKNCKDYINQLCKEINDDESKLVILDQFVPTSNIDKYLELVDNLKVIVVDRDPRDVFIKHFTDKDHVLPKDIHQFIINYRETRKIAYNENNEDVLRLNFEDIIYNYQKTMEKVNRFLNLDEANHIDKFKYLNPNISIKNTKLWEKYPQFSKEIQMIEKELSDFIYNY